MDFGKNDYKIGTDCSISIDGDDYVTLQLKYKELENILKIIFENVSYVPECNKLYLLEDSQLMNYLKTVESDLYNEALKKYKESKISENK